MRFIIVICAYFPTKLRKPWTKQKTLQDHEQRRVAPEHYVKSHRRVNQAGSDQLAGPRPRQRHLVDEDFVGKRRNRRQPVNTPEEEERPENRQRAP